MKVLVIGANGFVGRGVTEALLQTNHEVVPSARNAEDGPQIDLKNPESIDAALQSVRPDAIVDCAGIVENNEKAAQNPVFTRNLLGRVAASGLPIKRVVIMGSAGEYGPVDTLPVPEDTPRRATSPYGKSKIEEVDAALEFREKGVPVVVVRPFNPIGPGMPDKMLIPGVLRQIAAFRRGETDRIEVNRLDAKRDYIPVSDIGDAVVKLVDGEPKYPVYNVGSGKITTNRELIEAMLNESDLSEKPQLVETSDQPEAQFAVQADISRLQDEFGWQPEGSVEETIKEVMSNQKP